MGARADGRPRRRHRSDRAHDLDQRLVKELATVGAAVSIAAGRSIMMESTPADPAFVIFDGTVEIRRAAAAIARLGAGDVFGEIALATHRLRDA